MRNLPGMHDDVVELLRGQTERAIARYCSAVRKERGMPTQVFEDLLDEMAEAAVAEAAADAAIDQQPFDGATTGA